LVALFSSSGCASYCEKSAFGKTKSVFDENVSLTRNSTLTKVF
jgi:hypothetical protein